MKKVFHQGNRCFTLVEIMVAISIGCVLMLLLTQMVNLVSATIRESRQKIDTHKKAALIMRIMQNDLKTIGRRRDMGHLFTNQPDVGDVMYFYALKNGPHSSRDISLIGYKLQEADNGTLEIARGIRGYQWNEVGFMGLNAKGVAPDPLNLPKNLGVQEADFETISDGILKFDLCFQYKSDGQIHRNPPIQYQDNNQTVSIPMIQMTNLASLIVSFIMVDTRTSGQISEDQMLELKSRFSSPPEGITAQAHWNTNFLSGEFNKLKEGMPLQAIQTIRVYQRFFSMDPY